MAVDSWTGPLDGVQDFIFQTGAIEVKATAATGGFPATISSLEQLDDSLTQPLFLNAVRLRQAPEGKTLPEVVADVRQFLQDDLSVVSVFDSRLIHGGYLVRDADAYVRRFNHAGSITYRVDADFPRLTRANVADAIASARYQLNLELVTAPAVAFEEMLRTLGAI